jgi:Rps23 Pro-64 3,4-dihydroxylase Tpa1-like proline 4-hydroxylase
VRSDVCRKAVVSGYGRGEERPVRPRLNPDLDLDSLARTYAQDKFVQIEGLFDDGTAGEIEGMLATLPWRLVCQDNTERNVLIDSEQLAAMSQADRRELEDGILRRAARNMGFTYNIYPMIQARLSGWDRGHPIHDLTDFLNTPRFIELARRLIGHPGVSKIDAQATNYQPGHFLTRHADAGQNGERRAAYTIGFSRRWQPDWGGLLMFLDERLDVARAYTPRFNTLTVFDGLKVHSVSAVAPFAPAPRLSVVGWFRDDPIARRG